jgi:hypothetical protein
MRKTRSRIILGLIFFFSFVLIPYSESFGDLLLFYLMFSILWTTFAYLIWFGLKFLRYLLIAAITILGVVTIISYLDGHNRVALVSGMVSLGVLLSVILIIFVVMTLFLGPGVLAGLWIYNFIGSTVWSASLGFIIGLGIFALTCQLFTKLILPYSYGFGVAMLGGIAAHDLSNIVFRIHPSYLLNRSIGRFFDAIGRLNFESIENGILSIYLFLSWLLGGFGIRNWIIISAALGAGLFFVFKKSSGHSLKITRS